MKDYMEAHYTPFEQNMALEWAGVFFAEWKKQHPNADYTGGQKSIFDAVEGGLNVALQVQKRENS